MRELVKEAKNSFPVARRGPVNIVRTTIRLYKGKYRAFISTSTHKNSNSGLKSADLAKSLKSIFGYLANNSTLSYTK